MWIFFFQYKDIALDKKSFQINMFWISPQKYMLWVLIKNISMRHSYWGKYQYFFHYKNKSIQMYWKLYHQKMKIIRWKTDISHISTQNIDCGYSLELPQWGSSNEYPQSMFLSRNKKNNTCIYPCKPQFYQIKVEF